MIMVEDSTPERIRSIAKHLKKVQDEVLQIYIDDAKLEIQSKKVSKRYHEKLQRYLAAHLATLDYRRPSTQKIGDLQTSYSSNNQDQQQDSLESTEYGREYDRIMNIAQGSKDVRFGVM